jgi:hypothetical protein
VGAQYQALLERHLKRGALERPERLDLSKGEK